MKFVLRKSLFVLSIASFCLLVSAQGFAQTKASPKLPNVTQIDETALAKLIKPNGKPLLINFWATWCDPCREEFPELVQIDAKYKGKIDFITISLDDLEDISVGVPNFLSEMKAEMPAYLLKTKDEGAAISMVAPDWQGGLPFTILFDRDGKMVHFRQGKIKVDVLSEKIDKLITDELIEEKVSTALMILPQPNWAENAVADANKDFTAGKYYVLSWGLQPGTYPTASTKRRKIHVQKRSLGCGGMPEYAHAYNERMKTLLVEKYGMEKAEKAIAAAD